MEALIASTLICLSIFLIARHYLASLFRLVAQAIARSYEKAAQLLSEELIFLTKKSAFLLAMTYFFCCLLAALMTNQMRVGFFLLGLFPIACALAIRQLRIRRIEKSQIQLVSAIPQMANLLKAGHTVEKALVSMTRDTASPLKKEFQLVSDAIRLGSSFKAAFLRFERRLPCTEARYLALGIQLSTRHGIPLAQVLTELSVVAQTRLAQRRKLRALTSQARLQAYVSVSMPVFFLLIMQITSPYYLSPLFETKGGHTLLFACAAMLFLGLVWVRGIATQTGYASR